MRRRAQASVVGGIFLIILLLLATSALFVWYRSSEEAARTYLDTLSRERKAAEESLEVRANTTLREPLAPASAYTRVTVVNASSSSGGAASLDRIDGNALTLRSVGIYPLPPSLVTDDVVTNGDFNQPLSVGWRTSYNPGRHGTWTRRLTGGEYYAYYEFEVKSLGPGWAELYQDVAIPSGVSNAVLEFSYDMSTTVVRLYYGIIVYIDGTTVYSDFTMGSRLSNRVRIDVTSYLTPGATVTLSLRVVYRLIIPGPGPFPTISASLDKISLRVSYMGSGGYMMHLSSVRLDVTPPTSVLELTPLLTLRVNTSAEVSIHVLEKGVGAWTQVFSLYNSTWRWTNITLGDVEPPASILVQVRSERPHRLEIDYLGLSAVRHHRDRVFITVGNPGPEAVLLISCWVYNSTWAYRTGLGTSLGAGEYKDIVVTLPAPIITPGGDYSVKIVTARGNRFVAPLVTRSGEAP